MKNILVIPLLVLVLTSANTQKVIAGMDPPKLTLNNGKKWKVDKTMAAINDEANQFLIEFVSKKRKDFEILARFLDNKNNEFINNCSMTGKAHDELHKWLVPHMELIKLLFKAENQTDSEKIILKLQESFKTYYNYFE